MNSYFYIHKLDLMKLVSTAAVIMFTSLPAGAMITDDDSDDDDSYEGISFPVRIYSQDWREQEEREKMRVIRAHMRDLLQGYDNEFLLRLQKVTDDFKDRMDKIHDDYTAAMLEFSFEPYVAPTLQFEPYVGPTLQFDVPTFDFTLPPIDVSSFLIFLDSSNSEATSSTNSETSSVI